VDRCAFVGEEPRVEQCARGGRVGGRFAVIGGALLTGVTVRDGGAGGRDGMMTNRGRTDLAVHPAPVTPDLEAAIPHRRLCG
jgi:hypothetical protein